MGNSLGITSEGRSARWQNPFIHLLPPPQGGKSAPHLTPGCPASNPSLKKLACARSSAHVPTTKRKKVVFDISNILFYHILFIVICALGLPAPSVSLQPMDHIYSLRPPLNHDNVQRCVPRIRADLYGIRREFPPCTRK